MFFRRQVAVLGTTRPPYKSVDIECVNDAHQHQ
eukprot:COSAG02_NODE_41284_length_396_cov_0.696970_1_plen_32_part_01